MFPRINETIILTGPNIIDIGLLHSSEFNNNDLLSIDIIRGRDVGLQPYNQVRHFCGYPLAQDFDDLVDLMHIKVKYYNTKNLNSNISTSYILISFT